MDRDGNVYRTLPTGARGAHILPSEINDLSNSNSEGMEVIANDDRDVTPAQVESAKRFAAWYSTAHPGVQYFGHGEVNPGHKQATEGLTIANAVRAGVAPVVKPSTDNSVPLTQRTLFNYAGGNVDSAPMMDPSIRAHQKQSMVKDHLSSLDKAAMTPKSVVVINESGSSAVTSIGRVAYG